MARTRDSSARPDDAAPLPPVSGPVTMATVGRLAGVSQVTVSRALSDPSKVSADTLARIRKAIDITGFVPNALAGALASRRSGLVAAVVPSITNIVYSAMLQTFTSDLRASGYQILLAESGFDPAQEEALIRTLLGRRPDAMLLTGIHHNAQSRRMLLGASIPVVEVWDITESPIDHCVGFSHVEAGRAVARYAVEAGYRRFATVSAGDERARRRRDAFSAEIRALAGVDPVAVDYPGPARLGHGRTAMARLLERGDMEQGVAFCSSDLLAHGMLIEAQARGVDVPGRIGVIGFGDQDFAAEVVPALTTVKVDRAELGRDAAQVVLARLSGGPEPPAVRDVGFTLVRRQSG